MLLQRDNHVAKQLSLSVSKIVLTIQEEAAVLRVLRSGQLAQGKETQAFEEDFSGYIGSRYAVAVFNGTIALHLALLAIGLKSGDEVITTPFSFIASTNAILYVGAKPVFVDIREDFNIDVADIEKKITKRTKAILVVHLYGNPCAMDIVNHIAKKYHLAVVEDACQAHGAMIGEKKVGSLGDVGCFSFYATKNMTTGEGGMVTTSNKKLYEFLRMARSHGSKRRYYHEFLGYNFRMTEMQAALGRVQLEKLDYFNEKRIQHAQTMTKLLSSVKGLRLPHAESDTVHVYHHYTIQVLSEFPITRDQLQKQLMQRGIESSVHYPIPIHKQKFLLKEYAREQYPVAEGASKTVLSLPIHPFLSDKEMHYIAQTIKHIAYG